MTGSLLRMEQVVGAGLLFRVLLRLCSAVLEPILSQCLSLSADNSPPYTYVYFV